jgi:hypothetical protein
MWPTREMMKRTKNKKKRIRAIPTAAVAIPRNPNTAATNATMKNTIAQRNMNPPFCDEGDRHPHIDRDCDSPPRSACPF